MYHPTILFTRQEQDAVIPDEDSLFTGYNLTAISVEEIISDKTTLFNTGLSILNQPSGYYLKIVPNDSLYRTGYILNSGVIEPVTGRILLAFTKIDPTKPDLVLPFRECRLILSQSKFYNLQEV
jgi:hypothetical protein